MADIGGPARRAATVESGQAATAGAASPWLRWLIRIRAYYRKEINELRRQPLLILSLIGGPLLVLVLFGASYRSSTPLLRTAIVLPPGGVPGITPEQIQAIAGTNFRIDEITEDREGVEARLAAGDLDVVQVLPPDIFGALQRGESPAIQFRSNAINPLVEGWVQYLAYAEVNEINKELLRQQTVSAQREAATVQVRIGDYSGKIRSLEGQLSAAQQEEILRDMRELGRTLRSIEARLPLQSPAGEVQANLDELRRLILRIVDGLEAIERALDRGDLEVLAEDLRATLGDLERLDGVISVFVNTPPDVVVSPVRQEYANIRGQAYAAVVYYAPGVLALLIQHTAITLGSLALVRERLMGAFEVFRVAPVHMVQLLIGKYLGYTLFIALTAAVLIVVLLLLGIPLIGSWWQFALLILLLTLASLGVGFLISTVSRSDSQAIQLAMITLLISIFFSGFFIALDSFAPAALAVSYSVPMTHGVAGFQNIMLRGVPADPLSWIALAAIAAVTFTLVVALTRRQFLRA